jgi:hypothetical protein
MPDHREIAVSLLIQRPVLIEDQYISDVNVVGKKR